MLSILTKVIFQPLVIKWEMERTKGMECFYCKMEDTIIDMCKKQMLSYICVLNFEKQ